MPGVVGIYRAGDLIFPSVPARPQLASDVVLFVGDAIAVAVAETRDQAVDAAAAVIVDYDPLPVVIDSVKALEPNAALVQADREDNLIVDFEVGEPGALDGADVSITARFINQRLAAVPIEANAVAAEPDGEGGIRMWASTQVPFRVRTQVADALGLAEAKVQVIAPDVGGAFGAKLMTYPEQSAGPGRGARSDARRQARGPGPRDRRRLRRGRRPGCGPPGIHDAALFGRLRHSENPRAHAHRSHQHDHRVRLPRRGTPRGDRDDRARDGHAGRGAWS